MSIGEKLPKSEQALVAAMESELFKAPVDETPPILFHYTTASALNSIFASRELWATHFRYLNDPSEFLHGEEIFFREAKTLLLQSSADSLPRMFLQRFVDDFPKMRLSEAMNIYVTSFSENSDQLSQWRGYGDDGAGYSIGFKRLPRPTGSKRDAPLGINLYRCSYDAASFQGRASDLLKEVAAGFEKYVQRQAKREETARAFFAMAMSIGFRRVATEILRLKHGSYAEEKEWRLIVLAAPSRDLKYVRFRNGSRGMIPYLPIGLFTKNDKKIGIDRVLVGPGENQGRATFAAKMLLSSLGYPDDLVIASETPYRKSK
jgi:hypothetical protein